MENRLKYHFEPQKGWMNDPNGLVYFRGKYHAFFQHNPHDIKMGFMHWGHAVSDDLVNWQELPIALYPDQPYEDKSGCFSGSAIVKDDVLYLFYTSVSHELKQTQSLVISHDGVTFEKYAGSPIIRDWPADGSCECRDPKVFAHNDAYYMVVGTGCGEVGKIVLYKSVNLVDWDYLGVVFESTDYDIVLECPDMYPLGDKYILMFSKLGKGLYATKFILGDFDGTTFTPQEIQTPEAGLHFYSAQTFTDGNRRILIGWMYGKPKAEGMTFMGALSIPREVTLVNGHVCTYPVVEAQHLLTETDELVELHGDTISIHTANGIVQHPLTQPVEHMAILRDTRTIEIFINHGAQSFSYWTQ